MEKVKSILLALLVVISLLQSYLLSYSSPKYEPVNQSDYVQAELTGTQLVLDKLVFPEKVIIHPGGELQIHHVLYPDDPDYLFIYDNIKQTNFDSFRRMSMQFSNIDWDDVRELQSGIEVRFKEALPFNVLQSVLEIKIENTYDEELISKIWIYIRDEPEEIKTYFISQSGRDLYEATKTDMRVSELEMLISRGEQHPEYYTLDGINYIPSQPLVMDRYQYSYTKYTAEELKRSLFVDPGITRNLTERDGSEIYTDGKRGLQIKNEQYWMTYSDPIAPLASRSNIRDDLLTAIQFINQHGGWNYSYAIDQIETRQETSDGTQSVMFRQYFESYPVVNDSHVYYGYMKVILQRGIVANYERSIIVPDRSTITKTEVTLPGGEELEQLLLSAAEHGEMTSFYPAYRPQVMSQRVTLTPIWVVQYNDGEVRFLEKKLELDLNSDTMWE